MSSSSSLVVVLPAVKIKEKQKLLSKCFTEYCFDSKWQTQELRKERQKESINTDTFNLLWNEALYISQSNQ